MSDKPRPSLDDPDAWVPYRYEPSNIAAIIFVVLFSLTTLLHVFQLIKKRTWYFIPLVVGGIFEVLGYIGRIISKKDIWALGPFIMQAVLLLVAPALFAASIYIILGRIILLVDGEKHSLIRQKWLTKIFVTGDVLSFFVQSGGGGIQAMKTASSQKLGEKLILVGLFIQIVFFGFFIVVAGLFHWRFVKANPIHATDASPSQTATAMGDRSTSSFRRLTSSSAKNAERNNVHGFSQGPFSVHDLPWKRHLYALYVASALIMVRSIFRVIEYIQGNAGFLLKREVFLYVFDATLMLAVVVLFNWIHPSEVTDVYKRRKAESSTELREVEA